MNMLIWGQGYLSMSAPMKELERLILTRGIAHGNNPILAWNVKNLVAKIDPAGNIKPDKSKSRERIDGAAALIDAIGGMLQEWVA
jgi:phage terminase large subunit-like protein